MDFGEPFCQEHSFDEQLVEFVKRLPMKFNDRKLAIEVIDSPGKPYFEEKDVPKNLVFNVNRFLTKLDKERSKRILFENFKLEGSIWRVDPYRQPSEFTSLLSRCAGITIDTDKFTFSENTVLDEPLEGNFSNLEQLCIDESHELLIHNKF